MNSLRSMLERLCSLWEGVLLETQDCSEGAFPSRCPLIPGVVAELDMMKPG